MCCGTKRLTQIQCPSDCIYLASAREHPAASVVRQQQRDVAHVMRFVRDFSDRQSQLFLLIATFLVRYESPELQPLIDDDVVEAMRALASTYETSVRGVIYEHRPASLPAQRVTSGLKPLLDDAGKSGGTAFERDAAVVMRRIERAVADVPTIDADNRRAFLDLLGRIITKEAVADASRDAAPADAPRLIVP